jgi:3-dehydroquinate synthase
VQRILVRLPGRTYPILVGPGALGSLLPLAGRARVVVVSNARVMRLHGPVLRAGLGPAADDPVLVPDGERAKSRATLALLHDALLERGMARDGLVVAFGGGVVTDLAGFAAATWMRGMDWLAVPTTLLAMADAAVGGKVGINHPRGKNLIGAFHQPRAVVADTSLLSTLEPRQLRSGAYEVVKCGFIGDQRLLARLSNAGRPEGWSERLRADAVRGACRVKAEIVASDEREGGRRRLLNLGHTVGHALEAATGFHRLTHGEAVGWGLIAATRISRALGRLGLEDAARIERLVEAIGPRPSLRGIGPAEVMAAVSRDKKARAGRVPFILPTGYGRVDIVDDVPLEVVDAVVRELAVTPRSAGSAGSPSARAGGSRPRRTPRTAGRR